MQSFSGSAEKFQLKSYTKLMENLSVMEDDQLGEALAECRGLTAFKTGDGDDVIIVSGSSSVSCYRPDRSMDAAAVPIHGELAAAGADADGLIYVYCKRGDEIWVSREKVPMSGVFLQEERFDFSRPKDFDGIKDVMIRQIDGGFVLAIFTGTRYDDSLFATVKFSDEVYDRLIPFAFNNGVFCLDGQTRAELTIHTVFDRGAPRPLSGYTTFRVSSAEAVTTKLDHPAADRIRQLTVCGGKPVALFDASDNQRYLALIEDGSAAVLSYCPGISHIVACASGERATVFGVGEDQLLYVYASDNLFEIGTKNKFLPEDQSVTYVCTSEDASSCSVVYYKDNTLVKKTRCADSQDYNVLRFENQLPDAIRRSACYSTELTFLDPVRKTPIQNLAVVLWTKNTAYLETSDGMHRTDENHRINIQTGADGKLYVVQFTNKTDCEPILASLPEGMLNENEMLVINQYETVLAKYKDISGDAILNAKTIDSMGSGTENLLPDQYRTKENADALASSINQLTQGIPLNLTPSCRGVYTLRGSELPLLRKYQSTGGTAWSLSKVGDRVIYHALSEEAAARRIGELRASAISVGGDENGLFGWLGDFFEGVFNAVCNVVECVFQTVAGIVKATVHFIVNGVSYVLDTVIDTVSAAINFIETIFTAVLVFFTAIFTWLAALFQWNDVKRTQRALLGLFDVLLDKIPAKAEKIKNMINTQLAEIQKQFDENIDEICNQIAPNQSISQFCSDKTPESPQMEETFSNQQLLRMFTNSGNASGLVFASEISFSDACGAELGSVYDVIVRFCDEMSDSSAFAEAKAYLENFLSGEGSVFGNLFAALLKTIQGIFDLLSDGITAVVTALFDAAATVLTAIGTLLHAQIHMLYFEKLYRLMTGDSLTPLNLISFIAAVPVNLVYQAAYDKMPFASDSEVSAFLVDYSGLWDASQPDARRENEVFDKILDVTSVITGTMYCFLSIFSDAEMNVKPDSDEISGIDISCLIFEILWFGSFFPYNSRTSTAMDQVCWYYFLLGVIADGVMLKYGSKGVDQQKHGRTFTLFYGIGHLAITTVDCFLDKFYYQDPEFNVTDYVPDWCGSVMEMSKKAYDLSGNNPQSVNLICVLDFASAAVNLGIGISSLCEKNN